MAISLRSDVYVRRLNTTFGAQVAGLDLRDPLDQAGRQQLWSLLMEHKVLFFPEQTLDADSQVAFARQFGELTPSHPVMAPVDDDHPEIWEIDSSGDIRNDVWHSDVTFVKRPPLGSVLRAITIPEIGGDTSWGDLEAAYNSLSAPIRDLIDGLTAVHDGTRSFGPSLAKRKGAGNAWDGSTFSGFSPVEHPVVRVHPETGRKALFVESRVHCLDQGALSLREPRRPGSAVRAHHQAGASGPTSLVQGGRGHVGQPHHRPLREPGLRRLPQGHAARHAHGRRAVRARSPLITPLPRPTGACMRRSGVLQNGLSCVSGTRPRPREAGAVTPNAWMVNLMRLLKPSRVLLLCLPLLFAASATTIAAEPGHRSAARSTSPTRRRRLTGTCSRTRVSTSSRPARRSRAGNPRARRTPNASAAGAGRRSPMATSGTAARATSPAGTERRPCSRAWPSPVGAAVHST